MTVIALQPGEDRRWLLATRFAGSSGTRRAAAAIAARQCDGQTDPLGVEDQPVITTSRRTYLLEPTSTEKTWMASLSWEYPEG